MRISIQLIIFIIVLLNHSVAEAQRKSRWDFLRKDPVSLTFFNNATKLPPGSFTAPVNQPWHPGFTIGMEFSWKEREKYKIFQNTRFGYYYHRYFQQAIQLYTQAGYRRHWGRFSTEGSLLAGYLHSFLLTQTFVLQDDGTYKEVKKSRPQAMLGADIGVGVNVWKKENPVRLTLNYQFWLQLPFVKSYVPVLPNGSIHLGLQFYILPKKAKDEVIQ